MHETIIAKDIIDEAKKHGDVIGITVEVGDLGHLPSEEMKQVLQTMTNWKINIIEKKGLVECSCGYKGEPAIIEKKHGGTLFECPKCKSLPKIIEGEDIKLIEVQVE